MKYRWTMKELKEATDEQFLLSLVNERLSGLNPYSPLARRLQEVKKRFAGHTVILRYPDYMNEDGNETYTEYSESDDLHMAIAAVQQKAMDANTEDGESSVEDRTDFAVLAVFKGDLTPEITGADIY